MKRPSAARRLVLGILATGAVVAAAPSWGAPAFALSPWWHLNSSAAPTSLERGRAKNEIQRVAVSATGGEFYLVEAAHSRVAKFKFNATPDELRSGLEGIYGAGSVEVTGGPGDEAGDKPYVVTFTGSEADQPVPLMSAFSFPLSGGKAEATVSEAQRGAPDAQIILTASNLGDADVNGETTPVRITDQLPAGLRAVSVEGTPSLGSLTRGPVQCSPAPVECTFAGILPPYDSLEMRIGTVVEAGAHSGELNHASVSGGQAANVTLTRPIEVGPTTGFGLNEFELAPEEEGGALDTQAGSHPFQLTTTLALNQKAGGGPVEMVRDLHLKLPPGLVGNATVTPRCTLAQFSNVNDEREENACPQQSAVGVARISFELPGDTGVITSALPLFNLEPAAGEPARFGFLIQDGNVVLDTSVRTGGDYGVTVSANTVTQVASLLSSQVTFWGTPGDARHDAARGLGCLRAARGEEPSTCNLLDQQDPPPLLSLPASCTGPLASTVEVDSWQHPGAFQSFSPSPPLPALDGCDRLRFTPTITVAPDTQAASTPTGPTVDVHVPQDVSLDAAGLAESNVRETSVALPVGMHLNPAAAGGLLACSLLQIGLENAGEPACPKESKIATVEINTPLLPNPLTGAIYLAAQDANPFGSLVAIYLVAQDPVSGVLVKLAGEVQLNASTGQLITTFRDTPQLPFEDLKLHFFDGPRAPLSTPPYCGTYTTTASFAPWSGNAPVDGTSSFDVSTGPNGSACSNPLPFNPSLTAGSTDLQAGAFTPFTMTLSREDGNQNLSAIRLRLPEGLLGKLASVTPCGEPQATQGTCGGQSLIGHTLVSVGLGSDPYTIPGGQVFITGPYKGAPYGLSIAEPAKAGPFDLGRGPCDCVVVRAKIEVDPRTSALTVVSDPLPTMLQGIPVQLKHVNVTIDRPGFTFNPTNCSSLPIAATVTSEEGATAAASVPFELANCATLPFTPKFTVTTLAHTSKADGAYLHVRVVSGLGQANIAKVRVDLPKQLPSRLTTLQKACPEQTFNANPATCPAASVIGTATAVTPVLRNPLTGPAYLVSHAGAAFPDVVVVLQGEGITLDLVGNTDIKKGITISSFDTVPDAPISTFDLVLPEGPHSALAAYGSLCSSGRAARELRFVARQVHGRTVRVRETVSRTLPAALRMPTVLTGQNGASIKQTTAVSVTGCSRHRAVRRPVVAKRRRR